MSTNRELKGLHDQLLEQMPEGAEHDESDCSLCAMEADESHDTTPGGLMPESFTQEEVDAAVAAATAALHTRLEELGAQVQETEVGRAIAAAVADKETSISELQAQLDAAEAARTAAESQLTETKQFWVDAIATHEQELTFAARRDERITQAKEAGVFSEDYVADNADRFAAMADDDFANRLTEWRLIAAKPAEPVAPSKIPATTALSASQVDLTVPRTSQLGLIGEMRAKRIDPRTLGGI